MASRDADSSRRLMMWSVGTLRSVVRKSEIALASATAPVRGEIFVYLLMPIIKANSFESDCLRVEVSALEICDYKSHTGLPLHFHALRRQGNLVRLD